MIPKRPFLCYVSLRKHIAISNIISPYLSGIYEKLFFDQDLLSFIVDAFPERFLFSLKYQERPSLVNAKRRKNSWFTSFLFHGRFSCKVPFLQTIRGPIRPINEQKKNYKRSTIHG